MPAAKLTPDTQERVCRALQAGIDVRTACSIEGIGKTTYYDWRKRGEAGEEPYASFLEATERAMDRIEAAMSATIVKAAMEGHWPAAAWWLRFRRTGGITKVELSGPGGKPVALSKEAAAEIREKILFGEEP
jgi:hypothetical protein